MNKIFSDTAWEDYLFWLTDKKKLKRINELIRDIDRNMYEGILTESLPIFAVILLKE